MAEGVEIHGARLQDLRVARSRSDPNLILRKIPLGIKGISVPYLNIRSEPGDHLHAMLTGDHVIRRIGKRIAVGQGFVKGESAKGENAKADEYLKGQAAVEAWKRQEDDT